MTLNGIFDIAGRAALVTGASRGLGQHFARTLARHGASVALCARDTAALAEGVALIEAEGGRAIAIPLDVTNAQSIHACFDSAKARLGPVSILVNNAGVVTPQPWQEQSEAEWDRVIDTNLKGVWLTSQQFGRRLAEERRGGSIINIASVLGMVAVPEVPAYCASKAAVMQLTRSLAAAMAPYDIRVNALAAGCFETDMTRDGLNTPVGRRRITRIPQRRVGRYGELDGALLLLASDASSYMTGSVLVVDGGQSITL